MNRRLLNLTLVLVALASIGLAVAYFLEKNAVFLAETDETEEVANVQIGSRIFAAEVADTEEKKATGLSGREGLAQNEGMLFVFDQPEQPIFWMRDMRFSIDIIWIADDRIVDFSRNLPVPSTGTVTDDLPIYQPNTPVNYVLEVKAGESQEFSIGQQVTITRTTSS